MTPMKSVLSLLSVGAFLLALTGCDKQDGSGHAFLRGGKKVPKELVGWVAVPPSAAPQLRDENGTKYVVLTSYTGITPDYSGWVAINPGFFTKLTGITVVEPTPGTSWDLVHKDQRIPQELHGWVAVPPSYPKIESNSKKNREMAKLSTGHLIPKEMNGWIAVDNTTLAGLVEAYMIKNTTMPEPVKPAADNPQFLEPKP